MVTSVMDIVPMSALETTLIGLLENGREPTLTDMGGLSAIQQVENEIAGSPLLSEIIHILLGATTADEDDRESILNLTIRLVNRVQSLDMRGVINDIHDYQLPDKEWEKRFFQLFLDRAFDQSCDPLGRSFALEGAFRYVKDQSPRRYALLAKLTAVDESDHSIFLRHAAKIIGVAFSWWRSEDLVDRLKAIANIEGAGDEATFELGMAALVKGLRATECETVRTYLAEAQGWFAVTLEKREHRPDAALLSAVLQAWLNFSIGVTPEQLAELATRINREGFALQAWHHDANAPAWLGARFSEQVSWHLLARRLASLAPKLAKHSWLDARDVIEQELIAILTANRAITDKKQAVGLDLLFLPRISSRLGSRPGQIQHLHDWLEEHPNHPDVNIIKSLLNNTKVPDGDTPEPPHSVLLDPSPSSREHFMLERCNEILQNVDDFSNQEIKKEFGVILKFTFRYLISRMDAMKYPGNAFLFKPVNDEALPKEDRLQRDYCDYLVGNFNSGSVKMEQSNIASGRADIFVTAQGYRFIIEIKRERSDASFENLYKSYANQTMEYTNTGVLLGILLVLDLTEKSGGVAPVTEQVQAYAIPRKNETSKRGIVIVRVPGNRLRPSKLTPTVHGTG